MPDYIYMDIGWDCSLHIVQEHKGHDGKTRHACININRGKGFNFVESDDFQPIHGGILFACDRAATSSIRDFLEMQRLMLPADQELTGHRGPYYFTVDMSRDTCFETLRGPAILFGGPDTPYAQNFADETLPSSFLTRIFDFISRQKEDLSHNEKELKLARYNCWTATQGIVAHVAGIDLGQIDPELTTAYRAAAATAIKNRLYKSTTPIETDLPLRIRPKLRILQNENTPPVIFMPENINFRDLITTQLTGKNETLGDYLGRHSIFKGRRIEPAPAPALQL